MGNTNTTPPSPLNPSTGSSQTPRTTQIQIKTIQKQILLHYSYKLRLSINYSIKFPHNFEGLKLWDSNIALSRYIVMNTHKFKANAVLDVPAGTGIVGITLHKWTEVKKIVLVDMTAEIVVNIRNNFIRNHLQGKFVAVKMKWNEYTSFNGKYDILTTCDPFFHQCSPQLLLNILTHFLTDKGSCFISSPASEKLTEFLKLAQNGFFVHKQDTNREEYLDSPIFNKVQGENEFPQLCKGQILIYQLQRKFRPESMYSESSCRSSVERQSVEIEQENQIMQQTKQQQKHEESTKQQKQTEVTEKNNHTEIVENTNKQQAVKQQNKQPSIPKDIESKKQQSHINIESKKQQSHINIESKKQQSHIKQESIIISKAIPENCSKENEKNEEKVENTGAKNTKISQFQHKEDMKNKTDVQQQIKQQKQVIKQVVKEQELIKEEMQNKVEQKQCQKKQQQKQQQKEQQQIINKQAVQVKDQQQEGIKQEKAEMVNKLTTQNVEQLQEKQIKNQENTVTQSESISPQPEDQPNKQQQTVEEEDKDNEQSQPTETDKPSTHKKKKKKNKKN